MSDALSKLKQAHTILSGMIEEMEGAQTKAAQADDLLTQALLGPCSKCGEKFDPGQAIMQTSEGERFMHAVCPREAEEAKKKTIIGVAMEDWQRQPEPNPASGSCAGCGKPIYDELWHQKCAPKDEAQPIIPPWLRELERMRKANSETEESIRSGNMVARVPGTLEKLWALEALAKLRAVVLTGKGEAEVPDVVAAVRMHQGGMPPTGKLTARRYGGMEGVSFALDGVDYCYSPVGMVLEDIDAAGAEVCK